MQEAKSQNILEKCIQYHVFDNASGQTSTYSVKVEWVIMRSHPSSRLMICCWEMEADCWIFENYRVCKPETWHLTGFSWYRNGFIFFEHDAVLRLCYFKSVWWSFSVNITVSEMLMNETYSIVITKSTCDFTEKSLKRQHLQLQKL